MDKTAVRKWLNFYTTIHEFFRNTAVGFCVAAVLKTLFREPGVPVDVSDAIMWFTVGFLSVSLLISFKVLPQYQQALEE